MHALKQVRTYLSVLAFVAILHSLQGHAQQNPNASRTSTQPTHAERDGQHDFDFEVGTWKTRLSRLQRPLTGSTTWVKYEGTTVVQKVAPIWWNSWPMARPGTSKV